METQPSNPVTSKPTSKASSHGIVINIKNSRGERNLIERIVQYVPSWTVSVYDNGQLFWHAGPLQGYNMFYKDGKILNKLPGMEVNNI